DRQVPRTLRELPAHALGVVFTPLLGEEVVAVLAALARSARPVVAGDTLPGGFRPPPRGEGTGLARGRHQLGRGAGPRRPGGGGRRRAGRSGRAGGAVARRPQPGRRAPRRQPAGPPATGGPMTGVAREWPGYGSGPAGGPPAGPALGGAAAGRPAWPCLSPRP